MEDFMYYLYCRKCDKTVFNWINCKCAKEKISNCIPGHFIWIHENNLKEKSIPLEYHKRNINEN